MMQSNCLKKQDKAMGLNSKIQVLLLSIAIVLKSGKKL